MMNGNWKVFGYSLIGRYHKNNNFPNQDSFYYKISNNFISAAIADGLGSKKYSHIGSSLLTKNVIKLSRNFYGNKVLFEKRLTEKLNRKLNILQLNKNNALSTLMFVIIKNNKIYIAKIGDGSIIILGEKNLIIEEDKNFVNITIPFGYEKLKWYVFNEKDINFIFLATDGISDDIYDKIGFAKEFRKYFKKLSKYKLFKESKEMLENWNVKGSVDDKTFVCLMKEENEKIYR
jgi:serine/threonine protein phosphatase PrpC